MKVYDVSTTIGRIRAHAKGIKTTPFAIRNGRKVEGIPTVEELSKTK